MDALLTSADHSPRTAAGPIVVKLGGEVLDALDEAGPLLAALAAHRADGRPLVIVHGGGAAVDRHLDRLDLVSERREGIRLTPPDHIDEVVAVLAGRVNKALMGQLQRHGVPAVGLCLADGGLARTRKSTGYAFDPGHVGEIEGGDPRLVHGLLAQGYVPVFSSIGLDDDGHPLNVNADHAAAGLAALLGAARVVLLTNVPGVLDADGALLSTIATADVEALIADGTITAGMIPKVRGAAAVAAGTGIPVTITTWRDPAALDPHRGTHIAPNETPPADVGAFSPFLQRCMTRR